MQTSFRFWADCDLVGDAFLPPNLKSVNRYENVRSFPYPDHTLVGLDDVNMSAGR